MEEKKQIFTNLIFLVFLSFSVFLSGCASSTPSIYHNLNVLSQYHVSTLPSEKKINKAVGLNWLVDSRPLKERDNLPPGRRTLKQPLSDRVTSILLKDFEKSRIFKEIHSPSLPRDDIVITGSINRLLWDSKQTSWGKFYNGFMGQLLTITFLPSRLPSLLGAPERLEYCAVDISLEAKDNKTGAIIASFNAFSKEEIKIRNPYGPYVGKSATIAFSNVANQLKKDLGEKINGYFNSQIARVAGEE